MDKFTLLKYFITFKESTIRQYKMYQIFYLLVVSFAITSWFIPQLMLISTVILFLLASTTLFTNKIMVKYKPISEVKPLWKIGIKQFVGTEDQAIVFSVLECDDEQPELIGEVTHYT